MGDRSPQRDRAVLRRPVAPAEITAPAIIRHHNEPRPRRRRGVAFRAVGVVVLLASAAVAWGGYQVRSAQSSLTAARAETAAVQRQLGAYQWSDAGAGLTRARLHAQAANHVTDSRVWRLASRLPRFGDDVTAIGQVADTMDQLTRATRPLETVLPRLTALGGSTAGPIRADARTTLGDVAALRALVATLPSVSTALAASQAELAGAPATKLTASTRDGLADTREVVDSLRRTATSAAPVLSVLPAMLGASGERTWLVELEQPAVAGQASGERASRGRVGAYAIVRAGGGKLDVVETRRRPAAYTSTGMVRALQRRIGGAPDYVLVLDTPALAALVQATGPTTLGTTTIDGASTQRFLTQDILGRHHPTAWTDTVAAVVLNRSLTKLAAGQADWPQLIRSLGGPLGAAQVQLWAGDGKVQQQLLALSVAAGPDAGEAARIARVIT